MPKVFIRKSSTWPEIKSIFVKKSTGWAEVKNVFLKKTSGWVKVFTKANLPDTTTAPSIRTTNNGAGTIYDGPVATSPQFLDADLFGKDGVYTNYTSIFGRKFSRGASAGTTSRTTIISNEDRFTSAGGVTTAMRLACDDQFLFYELTVQNGSAANEIYPISPAIKMIKKQPALGSFVTSVTGNPTPGSTLTFNYNLENYYYNRVEQANSKIRWWRSSNTSPGGVMVKEEILTNTVTSSDSTSLSGTSTYQVDTSADNNSYIVVEIVVGSSWTRHNGYNDDYRLNSYSAGQVKTAYRFAFGNTFYVSSNGHIGLDEGTSSNTTMSAGRNIAVYPKDLVQTYLAEYSDSSVYLLYVKSYLYNTSASSVNALDYQIKFYNDPLINYCDVRIIRKGSNVSFSDFAPGYYSSGTTGFAGIIGPYVISAGTTMRIYFGGTATTTSGISWTLIDDAYWDVIQEWTYPPGADDIFTTVVSAANQSAPIPTTPTSLSTSINASNLIVVTFSGGTGDQYDLFYANQNSRPTDQQATTDFPNVTSPYTATTLNLRGITRWFWVRKSTGTLRSNWFPAGTGITARIPLFAPPTPVITNSAQASDSLSWHWTQPTPNASQDEPTSWDYNISTSTATPSSWTNITTRPTSTSPLVTGNLSANTDYYLHVRAKNDDNSTTTYQSGKTTIALATPTSLTATTTDKAKIRLTWSGGSGQTTMFYWSAGTTFRPDNTSTFADFTTDNASPYDFTTAARGSNYYFYVKSRNGTSPNFTYSTAWFPASAPGVRGRAPFYAPGTPTSPSATANSSTQITFSWTAPTTPSPNPSGPDAASGYDIYYSTSTTDPTSTTTATTTSTTASKAITGLSASTQYHFWVRATNDDNTGASASSWTVRTSATTPATFTTPAWNGTMPPWTAGTPFANGMNFRRLTTSLQYGWNNGSTLSTDTFSFSGSVGTTKGWDFYVSTTQPATTSTTRTPTSNLSYTTTTQSSQIGTTSFKYRINPTYTTASVYGSIRPYQFGTDGNKYFRSTWSGSI